jgi:hypothetical protein
MRRRLGQFNTELTKTRHIPYFLSIPFGFFFSSIQSLIWVRFSFRYHQPFLNVAQFGAAVIAEEYLMELE